MKHASAFVTLVEECMPRIKEISAEEVMANLPKQSFLFVDIREESEWNAGHASGAVHMGRGIIERDIERVAQDKNTPIVLYCGGGYRSALSADSLQKMGYTNVYSMAGGWRAWNERGFPTE